MQAAFCQTLNLDPIPSYYQEPGISPQRDYTNQHANETVDPFSGKLQLHYVDLFIPGNGGMDIKVQRSYSSGDGVLRDPSPYGYGWTMGFGRVLRTMRLGITICDNQHGSAYNPVLELPDGSRQILYLSSDSTYFISPSRWKGVCSGLTGMSIYSPEGTRYDMTYAGPAVGTNPNNQQQSWYPTLITDRNGNTLTITYKPTGSSVGVDTVTASDGRVVTFGYDAGTGAISSVTDGTRIYNYTAIAGPGAGYFYLTKVTRPDTTSWSYEYNAFDINPGAGSVKKVTYPTGGSFSYTYSLIRFNSTLLPLAHVVTGKTGSLDSSWAWTYAYTPATVPAPSGGASWSAFCPSAELDVTVVTGPDGKTTYCHVGHNSATAGNGLGYAIGSLAGKEIWDKSTGVTVYSAAFSSAYQVLSTSQSMVRSDDGVIFSSSVLVPVELTKTIDVYGQPYVTDYSGHDLYGNPGTITETGTTTNGTPDTRVTTLSYQIDPVKWVLHVKKDETIAVNGVTAGSITRQFDANLNLQSETRFGVANSWTYLGTGDVATHTDARGKVVTYSNYKRGVPQNETHPEGVLISRVVDAAGNVLSQTDGQGAVTNYLYDGLNRITYISPARGNPVTVTWAPNSRAVTRGASLESTTYDAFGRATKIVNYGNLDPQYTRDYLYDPLGRQIFASDPNVTSGKRTDYNAMGHETAIRWPCQGYSGSCETARYMGWNGKVRSVVNERGYLTTYTHRGFGDPNSLELLQISPPDSAATVTIKRNGLGKPTEIKQGGFARTYNYDSATNFLTSSSEPETGTTTFGRDAVGNMTSRQVGTAPATTYAYDDLNRLTSTIYPAGTPSVAHTYFKDGKIKSIDNGVSRRDYAYDPNKNLTKETLTAGTLSFAVGYSYSGNDALSAITYPSGKTVSYIPDAFGRPTAASPYVKSVSYAPSGAMNGFVYGNDVNASVSYSSRYLPNRINLWQGALMGASATLSNQTYAYGLTGNLLGVNDEVDQGFNRIMNYDSMDRLTEANGPWGTGRIQYDGQGNILSQAFGGSTLNYQYDQAKNRLTGISGSKSYSFSYDTYGNATGNGSTTFAYGDAQQLKCVRCGEPNETSYSYDGLGMRVTALPAGGVPTYFVYARSGNLLTEQTGQTVKEYAYLAGKQIAVRQSTASAGGVALPGGATSFAVALTASTTTPLVGDVITFSATITNSGTQAAASVRLTDSLSTGLQFVSATAGCTALDGVVQCALGDLGPGAQGGAQIVARVVRAGVATNIVSASSNTPIKKDATPNLATVTITATANAASALPTISLIAPIDGATFQDPATVTLTANASDSDGTIDYVDFYNGSTILGRVRTAPYSFVWRNLAPGTYNLSAKATDNTGGVATSNTANVTVSPGGGPTVTLTSPSDGATFRVPSSGRTMSIPLVATASSVRSSIARVEFFNGSTLIGTVQTAPYAFTWKNVAVGNYTVTAKAYDAAGKATTSVPASISIAYNQLPSVTLVSPANGATFGSPASIAISASASDSDGTVAKVEFYDRTTLLGSVTSPPYNFAWVNATLGNHVVTARATDNEGATSTSLSSTIRVISNVAPSVSLTAPVTGATYNAPGTIAMSATATDPDGTIAKVEFLTGSTLVGTSTAPPYSFTWTGVGAGTYILAARATDNLGAVTVSAPVAVSVNALPSVSITSPANGASFVAPATISIMANATDSDGTVSKVDFYNGATLIGTASASPFSFAWSNVAAGTYSLTAKATDNRGAIATSGPIGITVAGANQPPSVSLTAPANGASYNAPATVAISATASDSDGTISKVEFYNGTTLLGTDTTSPYGFNWSNVAAGSYSLTAKATDNKGAVTTSSPRTISVNALPSVSLTAPAAGATFTRPVTITLSATATDSNGTIAKVDFYRGTTLIGTDTTSPYSVTWSPSAAGTYSLTAKATDNKGATTTSAARSITVR